MTTISLHLVDADPRSSNVCSPEILEKLQRNIKKTGLYPPLIVRPQENQSDRYTLVDGHHRKMVLESLGYTEAQCQVWDINDKDAQLALATLNTLRGTEDLKKRAELLFSLTQIMPIEDLSQLIPETPEDIQDILMLLDHDMAQLERAIREQITAETEQLPQPLHFMIAACDMPLVEKALSHFQTAPSAGKPDRGVALVNLCRFALNQVENKEEPEQTGSEIMTEINGPSTPEREENAA